MHGAPERAGASEQAIVPRPQDFGVALERRGARRADPGARDHPVPGARGVLVVDLVPKDDPTDLGPFAGAGDGRPVRRGDVLYPAQVHDVVDVPQVVDVIGCDLKCELEGDGPGVHDVSGPRAPPIPPGNAASPASGAARGTDRPGAGPRSDRWRSSSPRFRHTGCVVPATHTRGTACGSGRARPSPRGTQSPFPETRRPSGCAVVPSTSRGCRARRETAVPPLRP